MKKKITALLALTLVSTLGASSAFATMPDKNDRPDALIKGTFKYATKFQDVTLDDWAIRFVTEMNAKGVINGYGDGRFLPSNNVTHEEAIVMTVRAMGLGDEAQAVSPNLTLDLTDAAQVSDWAKPYVSLALQNGFLDAKTALNPQGNADREWTTELVVRAMGLSDEAQAHMKDTLAFNDAKEIDASAVGYVAVAADHKIINGYNDHTFQPNKPVARNELAVILCNAEHLFDYNADRQHQAQGQLQGVLKTITAAGITFSTQTKGDVTYKVAAQSYFFLNNKIAEWSDFKPGMNVRVLLNQNGEVVFAQAKDVAPSLEEIENFAKGKVIGYTAATATAEGSISINNNKSLTLPVAKDAKVLLNGVAGQISTVKVNDSVRLVILDNTVIQINVVKATSAGGDDSFSPEKPVLK
ncbi:S-layer homology domain-containing protein [Tumebacillus sp. ITR2]|uniref:S-layer homology domain-containing protein n=1 Tax=Tumebacillus amylolyticus TaxID=2801339 RepID=A0ABS1JDJ0_9BACL|nr:S-layer homology domain-containing protein [Tumebacillus amylolyticus]MBL0387673.1 S-layer homology domain-containing protein [Tumebacillus amylolyticus]